MYKAEGIDLSQTEFDELRFVLSHVDGCTGAVKERTEADPSLTPAYRKLHDAGLLECHVVFGDVVVYCEPKRAAADWLASYEKGLADEKRLSRREWGMVAVNLGGGALLGGIASLAVAVIAHLLGI